MRVTIRQKILAIFLLSTLIIILAISGTYYYFLIQDIHQLSRNQIRIAFEMMLDDFGSQLKYTTPRVESFISSKLTQNMFVMHNTLKSLDTSEDMQESKYFGQLRGLISMSSGIINDIGEFVPLLGANEFVVYDKDRKAVVVYRHTEDQDVLGMYLHQFRGGTFISLRTSEEASAVWSWQSIQDIPEAPLPNGVPALYEGEIPNIPIATLSTLRKMVTLKLIVPIIQAEESQGVCVLQVGIRQHDIMRYSRFSQTEVNIFAGTSLSIGVLPDYNTISIDETETFYHIDLFNVQDIPPVNYSDILIGGQAYYQGKIIIGDENTRIGAITANFPRQIEKEKGRKLFTLVAVVMVVLGGLAVVVSFVISSRINRPIQLLITYLNHISKGEIPGKIKDKYKGELNDIKQSMNMLIDVMSKTSQLAKEISVGNLSIETKERSEQDALGKAVQEMLRYLKQVAAIAARIAEGDLTESVYMRSSADTFGQAIQAMMEGLYALIQQIRSSADQIAATEKTISSLSTHDITIAQKVHSSAEAMMSTLREMGSSVEEVAHNMDVLSSSVTETSASISQMTSSIGSIAVNTNELTSQTQETIAYLNKTETSLEEVVKHTDVSKQLSQATTQDALAGRDAIEQVTLSMETIQKTITTAVESITQFAQRSRDIDTILEVIREITDQTSLLALNASIIAAQAGVHGRGFAVVADEIRNLASGVGISTKDIATIVQTLQQDTNRVVQTIYEGAEDVKQGMERTQQARETLEKILTSAQRSSTVVTDIADTLHNVLTASHDVSGAMEKVNIMTDDITTATNQQEASTKQINQAIAQVNDMASQIQRATTEQLMGVHHILGAMKEVTGLIEQDLESSQQITTTTKELSLQANLLLRSVDRFKLSPQA